MSQENKEGNGSFCTCAWEGAFPSSREAWEVAGTPPGRAPRPRALEKRDKAPVSSLPTAPPGMALLGCPWLSPRTEAQTGNSQLLLCP